MGHTIHGRMNFLQHYPHACGNLQRKKNRHVARMTDFFIVSYGSYDCVVKLGYMLHKTVLINENMPQHKQKSRTTAQYPLATLRATSLVHRHHGANQD